MARQTEALKKREIACVLVVLLGRGQRKHEQAYLNEEEVLGGWVGHIVEIEGFPKKSLEREQLEDNPTPGLRDTVDGRLQKAQPDLLALLACLAGEVVVLRGEGVEWEGLEVRGVEEAGEGAGARGEVEAP